MELLVAAEWIFFYPPQPHLYHYTKHSFTKLFPIQLSPFSAPSFKITTHHIHPTTLKQPHHLCQNSSQNLHLVLFFYSPSFPSSFLSLSPPPYSSFYSFFLPSFPLFPSPLLNHLTNPSKYTFEDLSAAVQCSDKQLTETLFKHHYCNINGLSLVFSQFSFILLSRSFHASLTLSFVLHSFFFSTFFHSSFFF